MRVQTLDSRDAENLNGIHLGLGHRLCRWTFEFESLAGIGAIHLNRQFFRIPIETNFESQNQILGKAAGKRDEPLTTPQAGNFIIELFFFFFSFSLFIFFSFSLFPFFSDDERMTS